MSVGLALNAVEGLPRMSFCDGCSSAAWVLCDPDDTAATTGPTDSPTAAPSAGTVAPPTCTGELKAVTGGLWSLPSAGQFRGTCNDKNYVAFGRGAATSCTRVIAGGAVRQARTTDDEATCAPQLNAAYFTRDLHLGTDPSVTPTYKIGPPHFVVPVVEKLFIRGSAGAARGDLVEDVLVWEAAHGWLSEAHAQAANMPHDNVTLFYALAGHEATDEKGNPIVVPHVGEDALLKRADKDECACRNAVAKVAYHVTYSGGETGTSFATAFCLHVQRSL